MSNAERGDEDTKEKLSIELSIVGEYLVTLVHLCLTEVVSRVAWMLIVVCTCSLK